MRLKVRDALVRSWVSQMNIVRFLLKSLGLTVPGGVQSSHYS